MGNPAGRTFCKRCGAKLMGDAPTTQMPKTPGVPLLQRPGFRRFLFWLVLAALVAVIVFPLRQPLHDAWDSIAGVVLL
jgi:hypothetical protein